MSGTALQSLVARWRRWAPPWRRPEDPDALAEHLRVIYRDYVFNSPIVLAISLYIYFLRPMPDMGLLLDVWLVLWVVYIAGRFVAGVIYARTPIGSQAQLTRWTRGSVISQALDGLMMSGLALFIYPDLDPFGQVGVLAATLVLVGATAFSLAGRWLSMAVYVPPIYLSFAWATWHQEWPYAQGFAVFTLAMFGLYVFYASNQRRSVLKGFELAKLNGELASELQFRNLELQEVALGRSRLLATVSHDLRQPAHAIGLLAERALADGAQVPQLPGSIRQSLHNLNELSHSLGASLTTLMDLTRLDAGLVHANLADVPLAQVLLRVEAEFSATAKARGLQLNVPSSALWVHTDAVLLHGVLANLVSNALKYTRAGRVDLELRQDGDLVHLGVRDTGPGIRADKLDVIFKEFLRLEGSESGAEGLGLGLSIVRRYAALMGHRLTVQSEVGVGSCFCIELPVVLGRPESGQAVPNVSAPGDVRLAGLQVLVVDNVDLVLSSMVRTLSAWGCQVHAARSLPEARAVAERQPLDLVVSDFHLGDEEPDGLLLIQTLRAMRPRHDPPLPALLMTGDVSSRLETQARSDLVGILHKPVRPTVLQSRLIDVLSAARSQAAVSTIH